MYLEILNNVVVKILSQEGKDKKAIKIELTPAFYETVQGEINSVIKKNTEVPIERFHFESVYLYGRQVHLVSGNILNPIFEREVIGLTLSKNIVQNSIKLEI